MHDFQGSICTDKSAILGRKNQSGLAWISVYCVIANVFIRFLNSDTAIAAI